MAVTIAVQDLATDRDVSITVAGLVALQTVEIYYLKTDEDTPSAWTSLATISANGTSSRVMPSNGYFWFYGLLSSGITNLARSVVSSGDAIYHQIVDAVVARIQDSINASGFPRITDPTRVVSSYVYDPVVFTANVPGIAVMGNGKKIPLGGTNEEDDKGYPVLIICADRATSNTPRRSDDDYYIWQERLEQLFENKRMPSVVKDGIDIVFNVDVSFPDTVEFVRQNYHDVRVALQLTVKTREARNP
jgi:hypothetical protein